MAAEVPEAQAEGSSAGQAAQPPPAKRQKLAPGTMGGVGPAAAPMATDPAVAAAATAAPAAGAGAASEEDELRAAQLLDALGCFQVQRAERKLFLEVDVPAALAPEALVGRQLRVLWPDDEAWYLGTATAYDPATGRHQVRSSGGVKGGRAALEGVHVHILVPTASPAAAGAFLRPCMPRGLLCTRA